MSRFLITTSGPLGPLVLLQTDDEGEALERASLEAAKRGQRVRVLIGKWGAVYGWSDPLKGARR